MVGELHNLTDENYFCTQIFFALHRVYIHSEGETVHSVLLHIIETNLLLH